MKSVRAYLIALVVTCMLLATLGFGLLLWQARQNSRLETAAHARETAQALSQAVDAELERASGVLSALAESNAVQNRDWNSIDREARAAFPNRDAWVLVQDRSGQQLVNTRLPLGKPLPRATPPREMWAVLDKDQHHICNLAEGALEPHIVCVDVAEGRVRPAQIALTVAFRPQFFQSIVTRQNVERGQLASLVDRNGIVIWRNIHPDKFIGRSASPIMVEQIAHRESGSLESTSLEGIPVLTAFNRSALSGWTVIVGVPISMIDQNLIVAALRGSVIAIILILLACFLAALFGQRLTRGLEQLGHVLDPQGDPAMSRRTGLAEFDAAGDALRRASDARTRSERNQQMLIGELNHRVKNTLAVVQSLAHQTFRGSKDPAQSIGAFEARLQALGAAHNLLTSEGWRSAPIGEVVRTALKPFCADGRCEVDGPALNVAPQTAVSLSLALHELATNAVKYGAFSTDEGRVRVSWTADGDRFALDWQERGGPPVEKPARQGFGTRMIQRSLAAELNGTVDIDFAPEGLQCRVVGSLPPPSGASVLDALEK